MLLVAHITSPFAFYHMRCCAALSAWFIAGTRSRCTSTSPSAGEFIRFKEVLVLFSGRIHSRFLFCFYSLLLLSWLQGLYLKSAPRRISSRRSDRDVLSAARSAEADADVANDEEEDDDDEDLFSLLSSDEGADNHNYQEDVDYALALALEEQLNARQAETRDERLRSAAAGNNDDVQLQEGTLTATEKAWSFAAKLVASNKVMLEALHQNERTAPLCRFFTIVNADDVLYFAERLLQHRHEAVGDDTRIDIGYLTRVATTQSADSGSISPIRSKSLKTVDGPFGDGIYLANSPFFDNASVGAEGNYKTMMLARLKGAVVDFGAAQGVGNPFDSVIARRGAFNEICVVGRSAQCIPLLLFDSSLVDARNDSSDGNDVVHAYHCLLQSLLDDCFNAGEPKTIVTRIFPSQVVRDRQLTTDPPVPRQIDTTPARALVPTMICVVYYTAPDFVPYANFIPSEFDLVQQLAANVSPGMKCQLCEHNLDEHGEAGRLPRCSHEFHIKCLSQHFLQGGGDKCPICNSHFGSLSKSLMKIAANSKPSTLVIDVDEDAGAAANERAIRGRKLKELHCSPSTNYVSIVPSKNDEGSLGIPRIALTYACGSMFDVSLTRGQEHNEPLSRTWSFMFDNPAFLRRVQIRVSKHTEKCAVCREVTHMPEGKFTIGIMPTGTMRVDKLPDVTCSGYDLGAYLLSYRFESGIQKNFHDNPGIPYDAVVREAFVPCNKEGRNLLKRLKFAFSCGMTFKVGRSISTGQPNCVTWASISHKSSLFFGPFGYPDPLYLRVANEELDALGVPAADQL